MDPKVRRALDMRAKKKSWDEVARDVGLGADTIRKRVKKYMASQPLETQVEHEMELLTDENDPRIASLLAKAEVNLEEWEITRAVVNEWGKERNYQAKAWLKRRPEVFALRSLKEDLLADMAAASPVGPLMEYAPSDDPHMLELSPFDIHIGKLGWGEEVLDDYDSSIAEQRYKEACLDLISRSQGFEFESTLFPVGQDLLHVDTRTSTTTMGTYQDTDTRYAKIFRTSVRISRWTIDLLREIAPVKVVVIPGNHDELATFHVGEVLAAIYENDPHVTVDHTARLRKYHRYGTNLLGFTHGNNEKHDQLPLIMADEAADMWAQTAIREWHIGHRHNKKNIRFITQDQFRTTGVRILPSLTGQDYWHFKKGYRHIPQAEAHVWSRTRGHAATFTHTPEGAAW